MRVVRYWDVGEVVLLQLSGDFRGHCKYVLRLALASEQVVEGSIVLLALLALTYLAGGS